MERIEYRNAENMELAAGYDTRDYILYEFAGMNAAEVLPLTTRGYRQNGYSYNGVTMGSRIITLSIMYCGDYYKKKRYLERVFNPLLGEGVLTYTNDFISKSITVVPTAPPQTQARSGYHVISVELTAYQPFLYDTAENVLKMGDYVGGLTFPLRFGDTIQFAQKGNAAFIEIDGDVETPLRAEFRGPALNPRLKLLETGEVIEVRTQLEEGEKLWIETAYGNKTVIKEAADGSRASAYNLISNDSAFFQLQKGTNTVTFISDGGETEVYLYWRNRYVGV